MFIVLFLRCFEFQPHRIFRILPQISVSIFLRVEYALTKIGESINMLMLNVVNIVQPKGKSQNFPNCENSNFMSNTIFLMQIGCVISSSIPSVA